ncbi:Chromobox protein 1 [Lithohypha guttulata]|uniref:Chromobox protein 1 n=1 Tax=Lithohypha guttulata TaxID=1690604 RepID=UPI002DDE8ADD|nr:La ribonucleoprotein [Lithohypha guttulata]
MAAKRKADEISTGNHFDDGRRDSSPLAAAYGLNLEPSTSMPVSAKSPRSEANLRAKQTFHRVRHFQASVDAKALDTASQALAEAVACASAAGKASSSCPAPPIPNSANVAPTSNNNKLTGLDARCIPYQTGNHYCDGQRPNCDECKASWGNCTYPAVQVTAGQRIRCLGCQDKGQFCDFEMPRCSCCAKKNEKCLYPVRYPAEWCILCRQPGRQCDMQQPRCSTCVRNQQPCKYDTQPLLLPKTATKAIDLTSDAEEPNDPEYEVEAIRRQRVRKGVTEYLVKWKDYTEADNTWEPEENLEGASEALETFRSRHVVSDSQQQQNVPPPPHRPFEVRMYQPPHSNAQVPPQFKEQKKQLPGPPFPTSQQHMSPEMAELAAAKAKIAMLEARLANQQNVGQLRNDPTGSGVAAPVQQLHYGATPVLPLAQPRKRIPDDVKSIVAHRYGAIGSEYLVRWKDAGLDDDTWIPAADLTDIKSAILEFQDVMKYGDNIYDRPPIPYQSPIQTAEERRKGACCRRWIPHDILCIVNRRHRKNFRVEYCVHWKGPGPPTWETQLSLRNAAIYVERYHTSLGKPTDIHPNLVQQPSAAKVGARPQDNIRVGPYNRATGPQAINSPHTFADQTTSNVQNNTGASAAAAQGKGAQLSHASRQHPPAPPLATPFLGKPLPAPQLFQRNDTNVTPTSSSRLPLTTASPVPSSSKNKRGRPREQSLPDAHSRPPQPKPSKQFVPVVDLTQSNHSSNAPPASSGIKKNKSLVGKLAELKSNTNKLNVQQSVTRPVKHDNHNDRQQGQYLLIPENETFLVSRVFPFSPYGPYTQHNVAMNVLLAAGKHPWLPALNVRLRGLIDRGANGGELDAQAQHQRGESFKQYVTERLLAEQSQRPNQVPQTRS